MRKSSKFNITGTLVLIASMYAGSTFANDCNETSPNFAAQGENYYNLEATLAPSSNQKALLSAFIDSVSGDWKGKLTHLECAGSNEETRQIIKKANVSAKLKEGSNNTLNINSEAKYSEEKKITIQNIDALGNNNIFALEISEKGNLVFSEKYRENNRSSVKLVEKIYKIQYSDDALNISLVTYFNGYFASSDNWLLTRND